MPYRKKKKWMRAVKLDRAIDVKKLGSRIYVFNKTFSETNVNSSNHGVAHLMLYSGDSTQSELSDLKYIGANENELAPTPNLGVTVNESTKLFFQSAVLDVMIRNTSDFGDEQLNPQAVLEVDIYEVISSKKWVVNDDGTTLTAYQDMMGLFDASESEIRAINGTDALDYRKRGVTPWDSTYALGRYGMKILKKTKYRIGSGNTITYQMRDPKNRVASYQKLKEIAGCNVPGWSKHLWIVFKHVPGVTTGIVNRERIHLGVTRKYMYKVEGGNDKRASHVAR